MTSPDAEQPRHHAPRADDVLPELPAAWSVFLAEVPFYLQLEPLAQRRLRRDVQELVRRKHWHGVKLLVTDEIKVVIAAQAALLLLNLDHDYYPNVRTIAVHPTGFRATATSSTGLSRRGGERLLGEARANGTVVLAWDAVRRGAFDPHDGRNLVFHEFAHELDLLDGVADGRPPLRDAGQRAEWTRVLNAELLRLREQSARGAPTLLDRYGATNRAELFAVATECFFERGDELAHRHPELYLQLWRYYRQDTAARS